MINITLIICGGKQSRKQFIFLCMGEVNKLADWWQERTSPDHGLLFSFKRCCDWTCNRFLVPRHQHVQAENYYGKCTVSHQLQLLSLVYIGKATEWQD